MYLVYREKTTTATRAYESAKPRVGEPRTEPLTDSKVRRQSGRFSCLRTPELFGRVLQRQIFILRRVLANTRDSFLIHPHTHRKVKVHGKKIRSIEDRIDLKILDVARTAGVATGAVNVEVPVYRYVNKTNSSREPNTCLPLFTETKGSARSSLIRTIDLLRREYRGEKSMGLLTKRVVYCQPRLVEPFVCITRMVATNESYFSQTRNNAPTSSLESTDVKVGIETSR